MRTKDAISRVAGVFIVAAILLPWNTAIAEATSSPAFQSHRCPTASIPGGGTITFTSFRDGDSDLYIMYGSECKIVQLTNDGVNAFSSWSPDNSKLVFSSGGYLYVMNADGSGRTQLAGYAPGGVQSIPDWSPDGAKIVFQINMGSYQGQEIFIVNADGTNLQQLTADIGRDNHSPTWLPDSSQIVFTSRRGPVNDGDIWIMLADGTDQHIIMPDNDWPDSLPSMSPDGTRVAFASRRDGNWEIYVMDADGSNQTRLTYSSGRDTWPRWSPEGTRIAFQSDRDGNNEIYVMYADGSHQTRVTDNPAMDLYPEWGGPSLHQSCLCQSKMGPLDHKK